MAVPWRRRENNSNVVVVVRVHRQNDVEAIGRCGVLLGREQKLIGCAHLPTS